MKKKRNDEAAEYIRFKSAMKRLVAVPLAEVKELQKKNIGRPKRSAASRVATAKS